jgi:hypothetical protein
MQMPHVVPLFYAVKEHNNILISSAEPVIWTPASNESHWSTSLTYAMMLLTSVVFPFTSDRKNNKMFVKGAIGVTFKINLRFLIQTDLGISSSASLRVATIIFSTSIFSKFAVVVYLFLKTMGIINWVARVYGIKNDSANVARM